jgi:Protein of unknown function (DUF3088)
MIDTLFLLKPDFLDPASGPDRFYCPHCAAITGVLTYYPRLRTVLDVQEVDYPRPRPAVAALMGPSHPGCPLLVLADGRAAPVGITTEVAPTGRRYIANTADIMKYLAQVHGAGSRHP